jgi:hypothetical protein
MAKNPALDTAEVRELLEELEYVEDRNGGATGRRCFVCRVQSQAQLPKLGDRHPYKAECLLYSRVLTPYGQTGAAISPGTFYVHATCDYSTDFVTGKTSQMEISLTGGELATFKGRRWVSRDGLHDLGVVDQELPFWEPMMTIDLAVMRDGATWQELFAVASMVKKVNSKILGQFAVERVLLEGFRAVEQYSPVTQANPEGNPRWRWEYNFKIRVGLSHNWKWRTPVQDVDGQGNPIFYQDKDAFKEGYIAPGAALHDACVGAEKPVTGLRGIADWSYTYPRLYESADLNTLPGIVGQLG